MRAARAAQPLSIGIPSPLRGVASAVVSRNSSTRAITVPRTQQSSDPGRQMRRLSASSPPLVCRSCLPVLLLRALVRRCYRRLTVAAALITLNRRWVRIRVTLRQVRAGCCGAVPNGDSDSVGLGVGCEHLCGICKSSQVKSSQVKSGHTPVEGAGGFMGELTRGANACIRGGRRSLGVRKSHGEC